MRQYIKNDVIITEGTPIDTPKGLMINPKREDYLNNGWEDYVVEETLPLVKALRINALVEYDSSEDVNRFYFCEQQLWFDKATRVGLMNAVNAAEALGEETITFGIGDTQVTLPIAKARDILNQLEMYALKCYNQTLVHKANINNLTTIEGVKGYNFTTGYPEYLHFDASFNLI